MQQALQKVHPFSAAEQYTEKSYAKPHIRQFGIIFCKSVYSNNSVLRLLIVFHAVGGGAPGGSISSSQPT